MNQSVTRDVKLESIQHSSSGSEQVVSDVPEKRYDYLLFSPSSCSSQISLKINIC